MFHPEECFHLFHYCQHDINKLHFLGHIMHESIHSLLLYHQLPSVICDYRDHRKFTEQHHYLRLTERLTDTYDKQYNIYKCNSCSAIKPVSWDDDVFTSAQQFAANYSPTERLALVNLNPPDRRCHTTVQG